MSLDAASFVVAESVEFSRALRAGRTSVIADWFAPIEREDFSCSFMLCYTKDRAFCARDCLANVALDFG